VLEATHTQGVEDPLKQLNQVLGKLSLQVRDLFERKQFQQAELIIQQVLSIVPNHPIALMNLATVNLRLQRYRNYMDFPQYYAQQIRAGLWYIESFPIEK
jgi:hypothetical protein